MKLILRLAQPFVFTIPTTRRFLRRIQRRTRRFIQKQRGDSRGFASIADEICITRCPELYQHWIRAIFRKKKPRVDRPVEELNTADERDEAAYNAEGAGEYEQDGFVVSDSSVEYLESDCACVTDSNIIICGKRKREHNTSQFYESSQHSGSDSDWQP